MRVSFNRSDLVSRKIIGSTWNRDNRNGINGNFEELYKNREFIESKVDDYTNLLNNSIAYYQKDVYTPVFEMGNFTQPGGAVPGGNNVDSSTTRIRQTQAVFLKAGMTMVPSDHEDFEYSMSFWTDTRHDGTSEWMTMGTQYQLDKARYIRLLIRRKDGGTVTQTDVSTINDLFGDIRMRKIELKPIEYSQGFIYTSGEIRSNATTPTMITMEPVVLSEGFTIGLHSYDKYNLNVVMFDYDTGQHIKSSGRDVKDVNIEQFCLCYLSPQKLNGEPVTSEDIKEVEKLTFTSKDTAFNSDSGSVTRTGTYNITDDIEHDFEAFSQYSFGNIDAKNITKIDIDSRFRILKDMHPDYIKRNNVIPSVNGETIYEYTLESLKIDSTNDVVHKKPKVLIVGGVHGDEKSPVFAIYNFVNLLANHWQDNKLLEFIRFNIDFKIIPLANPDGFDAMTRRNANNVDINRDFPTGWTKVTSGSGLNGDNPLSQPETQNIYNLLNNNSDALFGIDFHNSMYGENTQFACWAGSIDDNQAKVMQNVISLMGRKWKRKYPAFPQDLNHKLGNVRGAIASSASHEMVSNGIPATTLEVLREVPWQDTPHLYDELASTIALELLVETIKANIKTLV